MLVRRKRKMKSVIVVFSIICLHYSSAGNLEPVYEALLNVMNSVNEYWSQKEVLAEWDYASNITDENLRRKVEVSAEAAKFNKILWNSIRNLNWQNISNEHLRRQFEAYSLIGSAALQEKDFERLTSIVSQMESIYSTAKVCVDEEKKDCKNSLEPELENYLQTSDDPTLLARLWTNWRDAVGPHVKELYSEYVELSNKAAKLNGFKDNSEMWLENYEDKEFESQIKELWMQVKPLYLEIHAYVRWQLRNKYGDIVKEKGPIPAHLLGNMWAQQWTSDLLKFAVPYPEKRPPNVNEELFKQNYTTTKIFETADEFFQSINLTAMPKEFWEGSILQKPKDRDMVCHASAWDFYDGVNFRIKQCTEVTIDHFYTAHHEMGHIEYFLQYKDQPVPFREGANHGFHEAIGDAIALSVRSTTHMRKIGLLNVPDDEEILLNNLYITGLEKIVFLPFGYLMDLWRWDVFKGETKPENYNCKWWELREEYQGVEPPVDRSEEDFDPAAKYHIISDVPYIRYFVSFIIQFQFHKALCVKAGQYIPDDPEKPLYKCDIYQSAEAGNALKNMLAMGSSKPWPDAMEALTGQRKMDASGLLEFFKPLHDWLHAENIKNNAFLGWEKSTKVCGSKKGST